MTSDQHGARARGDLPAAGLPAVDAHAVEVAADADAVWSALLDAVEGAFSRRSAEVYARLVGDADATASGPRPLAVGSTLPGFHVVGAVPRRELALEGRHRFSSYALTFRLDPLEPGRCRLQAETRAAFPGPAGGLYRLLVVRTGGHAVAVRRLLATVQRRAEQAALR